MANKRLLILDYMHLSYAQMYGNGGLVLSHTIKNAQGMVETVITTLTTSGSKWVVRNSEWGNIPTAVCFDGGAAKRKETFARKGIAYKGSRDEKKRMSRSTFDDIDRLKTVLQEGGISVYSQHGVEADDYVISLVNEARKQDAITGDVTEIFIVTNDADMLPLVDENTIVYKRSNVSWARTDTEFKKNYRQFTVESFSTMLSGLSDYKNYDIPYNSIYLHKLLKGDSADDIPSINIPFGAKKYNQLVQQMWVNNVDFPTIFRYGTSLEQLKEVILSNAKEVFTEKVVDAIETQLDLVYEGYQPEELAVELPKMFNHDRLQVAVSKYGIKLPRPVGNF